MKISISLFFSANEDREKREAAVIALRKQAREEQICKRRAIQRTIKLEDDTSSSLTPALVEKYLIEIQSADPTRQLNTTRMIRTHVAIQSNPPIHLLISNPKIVPRIMSFMTLPHDTELQFEAAWILSNIAAGDHSQTQYVVELGIIPLFIQMLRASNIPLRSQALWGLANIAGDTWQYRNLILETPHAIENLLLSGQPLQVQKIIFVAISICRFFFCRRNCCKI